LINGNIRVGYVWRKRGRERMLCIVNYYQKKKRRIRQIQSKRDR